MIAVADYFECSLEFLVGRSENDTKISPKACSDFCGQIRKVMKEKGFTTYSLLPTLLELASLFDCTLDYLVGREE